MSALRCRAPTTARDMAGKLTCLHPAPDPDHTTDHAQLVFVGLDRRHIHIVAQKLEHSACKSAHTLDRDQVTITQRPDAILLRDDTVCPVHDDIVVVKDRRHHRIAVATRQKHVCRSRRSACDTIEPVGSIWHEAGRDMAIHETPAAQRKVQVYLGNQRHAELFGDHLWRWSWQRAFRGIVSLPRQVGRCCSEFLRNLVKMARTTGSTLNQVADRWLRDPNAARKLGLRQARRFKSFENANAEFSHGGTL
ncbi:hypothetical protein SPHV1_2270154 [Novosphingobium sp. KN65.2]|nr:hypothetical protein SPHV1_2270154 [Novosphingobium sp. KN65.2]